MRSDSKAVEELTSMGNLARESRVLALKMVHKAKASHIGSSLSVIDVLVASYHHAQTNTGSSVFLSKGHAAAGLYAVLNKLGSIPDAWIDQYCQNGSMLGGHATRLGPAGIIFSTGSLGHALPFAVGVSLRNRTRGRAGDSIVILSDGECDEGSNWEAALVASHLELSNLVVVIDRNRLQSFTDTELTLRLEPLADKWIAFGWDVTQVDGHSIPEILKELGAKSGNKPKLIIANTIKGKGVSFMEGNNKWHYRSPNNDELQRALRELGAT